MQNQNVSTETTEKALINELPESQSFTTQLPSQTKKSQYMMRSINLGPKRIHLIYLGRVLQCN